MQIQTVENSFWITNINVSSFGIIFYFIVQCLLEIISSIFIQKSHRTFVSHPKRDLQFGWGPHDNDNDQNPMELIFFFFPTPYPFFFLFFFFIPFSQTKQTTILLSCCILMQTSGAVALCSLLLSTLFTMYTGREYQLPLLPPFSRKSPSLQIYIPKIMRTSKSESHEDVNLYLIFDIACQLLIFYKN